MSRWPVKFAFSCHRIEFIGIQRTHRNINMIAMKNNFSKVCCAVLLVGTVSAHENSAEVKSVVIAGNEGERMINWQKAVKCSDAVLTPAGKAAIVSWTPPSGSVVEQNGVPSTTASGGPFVASQRVRSKLTDRLCAPQSLPSLTA
jgi:hypothetical protein